MSISAVDTNSSVYALNLLNSNKTEQVKNSGSSEISDVFSESDKTQKFKDIVGKYDVTNMSHQELCGMSKELLDNGLISFKEHMRMTFDYGRLLKDIEKTTGQTGGTVSGFRFGNTDEKINYLDAFKTMADFKKKAGESNNLDNDMVNLFEKFQYFQSN